MQNIERPIAIGIDLEHIHVLVFGKMIELK